MISTPSGRVVKHISRQEAYSRSKQARYNGAGTRTEPVQVRSSRASPPASAVCADYSLLSSTPLNGHQCLTEPVPSSLY